MGKPKKAGVDLSALTKKGGASRKKGKKNRKIGRSKRHPAAQRYLAEKRWIRNRTRRIRRHLRAHPNDAQAARALQQQREDVG